MTTGQLLLSAWDWEPSVAAGCVLLAAAGAFARMGFWFYAGVALLLIDLVSPIDALGDGYLFSAHVLQHFLLALMIPVLWLLGTPRAVAEAVLRRPAIGRIEHVLSNPLVAWPLGVGTMLAWHVPVFFNAALASDALHIAQHLTFLITGVIFWWPVLHPIKECRLQAFRGIFYLFSACTACSMLGAILTFGPAGMYPAYLNPPDPSGIMALVRNDWGLDTKNDQQLGGLLMWVPGCFVYLSGILATAVRWFAGEEASA